MTTAYGNTDPQLEVLRREIEGLQPVYPDSGKIKIFKFETNVDKSYFHRPLPSKIPGKLMPIEKVLTHYKFHNPNTDKPGGFSCLTMFGLPCPLCMRVEEMRSSGNPEMAALADEMMAKEKYSMPTINMETNEIGVLQFSGKKALEAFTNKFVETKVEMGSMGTDLNNGVVFQIDKSGTRQTLNFNIMIRERAHKLTENQIVEYNELAPTNEAGGKYTTEDYYKVLKNEKFGEQSNKASGSIQPDPAMTVNTAPQTQYQQPVNPAPQPTYQQQQPIPQVQQPVTAPAQPVPQTQYQQPVSTQSVNPVTTNTPTQTFPNTNQQVQSTPSVEDIQKMLGDKK